MRINLLDNQRKCNYSAIRLMQMKSALFKGVKLMYANLDREIGANKMSWRSVSRVIGMPESTFRSKITSGEFSINEAFKIKNLLFPKLELEYLFEQTEAS